MLVYLIIFNKMSKLFKLLTNQLNETNRIELIKKKNWKMNLMFMQTPKCILTN